MTLEWKKVLTVISLVCLAFFGIPIKVNKSDDPATEKLFKTYIQRFNKSYDSNYTEYSHRLSKFKVSLSLIENLNKQRISPHSAVYGITKYSDMSSEEFLQHHLQPEIHEHIKARRLHHRHEEYGKHDRFQKRALPETLPKKVDWRDKKIITQVRNQKQCGACWAFSTVETVEAMFALKTGVLQPLSVQEMVDCARNGNMGCQGGDTCSLLQWLVDGSISIEAEKEYPLLWKTDSCKLKGSGSGVRVAPNYTCDYLVDKEQQLLSILANHGPVAVAVNAINWQNYLGGIIQYHCDGAPDLINHAVQLVGFDTSGPVPHYIARNSWGLDFGDAGYLYIAVGSNLCGIATEVTSLDVL